MIEFKDLGHDDYEVTVDGQVIGHVEPGIAGGIGAEWLNAGGPWLATLHHTDGHTQRLPGGSDTRKQAGRYLEEVYGKVYGLPS